MPKTDPHSKKVMLSIWWEVNEDIQWEILLPSRNETLQVNTQMKY